jgi:hypothetical protein
LWIEHESRKKKREWPYFKIIIKKNGREAIFYSFPRPKKGVG